MESRAPRGTEWAEIIDALHGLTNMMTTRSHYAGSHPAIQRADDSAAEAFTKILEHLPQVLLAFIDGEFVVCERPHQGLRDRLHVLAGAMARHDLECIVFQRGLTKAECESLAKALMMPADAPGRVREQVQPTMPHILLRFLEVRPDGVARKSRGTNATDIVPMVRELLSGVVTAVTADAEVDRLAVIGLASRIVSIAANRSFALEQRCLADGRENDAAHAANVALATAAMALVAELPEATCIDVTAAALLHDVGHMLAPRAIRGIPEPLLDEQGKAAFREHTIEGATALFLGGCPDLWVAAALEHHRGVDGRGYPTLESTEPPHELVRIIALANYFDRKRTLVRGDATSPDDVLRLALGLEDRYFGRGLVRRFVRALGCYPPGTTVELSNREPAIVAEPNVGDPLRPQVQLLRGKNAGLRVELRDLDPVSVAYQCSITRAIAPPLFVVGDIVKAEAEASEATFDREQQMDLAAAAARAAATPLVKEGPRKATVDEVVDELARHAREEEEKKQRSKPPRVSPAEDALRARLVEFLTAEPPARPVSSRPSAGSYSERPPEVESPPPRKPSSKPPVVTAQSKRPSVGSYSERPPEVESPPPPKPPAMAAPSKLPPRVSGGYTTLPPDEVITVTSRPPRVETAVSKPPPPSASRAPPARKEPVLVLTATIAAIMKEEGLDPRAGYILSFVDGAQTADEVVGACGLPADQVNAVIDDLLLRRLIARK